MLTRRQAVAIVPASFMLAQTPPPERQVFLLTGQSNMAGRGVVESADKQPLPRVSVLNKQLDWAPAVDPLHYDKPDIAGVGLGRTFARFIAAADQTAEIGLVPAAFGGSALAEWMPGEKHYVEAVRRAKHALKQGRLRGILWHQGEADSSKEELAGSYGQRWKQFITSLREELGVPGVPVVAGQLGEFMKSPFASVVNEQLALLPLRVAGTGFVSSAGLVHKGDEVHFDTPSLHEFGRRYAHAWMALAPSWERTNA